jgi:hypothetical protein
MRHCEHLKTTRVQQPVYAQASEASSVITASIQDIATLDEQIAQIERQIRQHFNAFSTPRLEQRR